MKKQITFILISFIMICQGLCYADILPAVSLAPDKIIYDRGERITYKINVENEMIARGIQIGISYNTYNLSPVKNSLKLSDSFEDVSVARMNSNDGIVGIIIDFGKDTVLKGYIGEFSFDISDTAVITEKNVAFTSNKVKITDANGNLIDTASSIADFTINSDYKVKLTAKADKNSVVSKDVVTYNISMSELMTRGLQFSINYNNDYLTFNSFEDAQDGISVVISEDKIGVVYQQEEIKKVSGQLLTLKFNVNENIEPKAFIPVEADNFKSVDEAATLQDVAFSYETETINFVKDINLSLKLSSNASDAPTGGTVEYTLSLTELNKYKGFQTGIKYNADVFELVKCEKLSLMNLSTGGFDTQNEGTVGVVCVFENDVQTKGDVAKITLKVKEDAPSGDEVLTFENTAAAVSAVLFADAQINTYCNSVYIYKGNKMTFTAVPSMAVAVPGDMVYYTFYLPLSSEKRSIQWSFNYDSSLLELTEFVKGPIMKNVISGVNTQTPGIINATFANSTNGESNEVCTVGFKVLNTDKEVMPKMNFSKIVSPDYVCTQITPLKIIKSSSYSYEISASLKDGNVDVSVKENISYSSEEIKIYIAEYNAKGAVVKVEIKPLEAAHYVYECNENTNKIKCFVWDNMKPFEAATVTYE